MKRAHVAIPHTYHSKMDPNPFTPRLEAPPKMTDDNLDDTCTQPEIDYDNIPIFDDDYEVTNDFINSVQSDAFVARHSPSKKVRKRSIKALRDTALGLAALYGETLKQAGELQDELDRITGSALKVVYETRNTVPSDLRTGEAHGGPSCVINEHAHGDDAHASPWAHTDPAVNAKLNKEGPEPATPMPAPIDAPEPAWHHADPEPTYKEAPDVSAEGPVPYAAERPL